MSEIQKESEKRNINLIVDNKKKILKRLRTRCEDAKIELTLNTITEIEVDIKDEEFLIPITRSLFNKINKDVFQRTIDALFKVMNDVNTVNIDYYILVGGSSLIPRVKEILHENFPKRELLDYVSPIDAVVIGTTYYANDVIKNPSDTYKIHDILNHSIGIQTCVKNNKYHFQKLLKQYHKLPAAKSYIISASKEESNFIAIYEGENDSILDCHFLYYLQIFVPVEYTDRTVKLVFVVDGNGLLIIGAGNGDKTYKAVIRMD